MPDLGVVVIGRNEGDRLIRCLRSLGDSAIVYVDSGSTDGSADRAASMGAEVVRLDLTQRFTAARGRNAGLSRLIERWPNAEWVQFVDGDCELASGWLAAAARVLDERPDVAVVCGRRRERFPDATRYNKLCDLEWDTPIGEATACGGDALMRVSAVQSVGGYRESLIAGEEPELCARLRAGGWRVLRVAEEMTLHDAAMTRFGQWWLRAVRAGHAYAEISALHKSMWQREVRSNWAWGCVIPALSMILIVGALVIAPVVALFLTAAITTLYAALATRIYQYGRRRGWSPAAARLYAAFTVLAKFPLAWGQAKYRLARWTGRAQPLIEYKAAEATPC